MTFSEPYARMIRTDTPDGLGGNTARWTEGATIAAAIADVHETIVTLGGGRGVKQQATLYLSREETIAPGEVLRRASDGALFRLTGYGVEAPAEGEIPLQKVPVERMMT